MRELKQAHAFSLWRAFGQAFVSGNVGGGVQSAVVAAVAQLQKQSGNGCGSFLRIAFHGEEIIHVVQDMAVLQLCSFKQIIKTFP